MGQVHHIFYGFIYKGPHKCPILLVLDANFGHQRDTWAIVVAEVKLNLRDFDPFRKGLPCILTLERHLDPGV